MKKTLNECIEQFKFYSGKCCDAICNHENEMINFYEGKLFDLVSYASATYNVDLNCVDLSEVI